MHCFWPLDSFFPVNWDSQLSDVFSSVDKSSARPLPVATSLEATVSCFFCVYPEYVRACLQRPIINWPHVVSFLPLSNSDLIAPIFVFKPSNPEPPSKQKSQLPAPNKSAKNTRKPDPVGPTYYSLYVVFMSYLNC